MPEKSGPALNGAAPPESRALSELETLVRARYPILYVVTWEEERVEQAAARVAQSLGRGSFSWSVARGVCPAGAPVELKGSDPLQALREAMSHAAPAIYLLKDFHPYLAQPEVVRALRELSPHLRRASKTLIIVSPTLQVPTELEKTITVLDMPLPDYDELARFLDAAAQELKAKLETGAKDSLVRALSGLTLEEAGKVLHRAFLGRQALDDGAVPAVLAEKKQIIRKSGALEYHESKGGLERVGGLRNLKEWFKRRQHAFTDRARKFGLPPPKGILLLGVPGCGKSLCAKALSAAWRQPLLRLDLGRVFSGLAGGSSDGNIRQATLMAESVAPSILWVDEIDKAFAGIQEGGTSTPGAARVFGSFITWLQEKTTPVFVVATANSLSGLPPELLRKGRFDEIFFVDLPSRPERREIFAVHIAARGRDPKKFDLDAVAQSAEDFSGAEIEQAVVSGLYEAFDAGRELSTQDVMNAVKETAPLYATMKEQITDMRMWAKGRARLAS